MKIATWNDHSLRVRLPHVLEWLAVERPDVRALQETKLVDAEFPVAAFEAAGYRARCNGQKGYTGVATVSRGQVLFSAPERAVFQDLLNAGLCDSFRLLDQPGSEFSWWDYRMGAFRRHQGLRIDSIAASGAMRAAVSCRIDRGPRGRARPSNRAGRRRVRRAGIG